MTSFPQTQGRRQTFTLSKLRYTLYFPLMGESKFIYEACLKVEGGVKFVTQFSEGRPSESQMTEECQLNGIFSARPYVVGQPTDWSTIECVLALYYHYCLANGLDPTALLARTYPGFETPDKWTPGAWLSVCEAAEWLGTTIPETWLEMDVFNFMLSLQTQGLRKLAETLVVVGMTRVSLTGQGEPS